jgi:hypothetical protein
VRHGANGSTGFRQLHARVGGMSNKRMRNSETDMRNEKFRKTLLVGILLPLLLPLMSTALPPLVPLHSPV